MWDWKWRTNAGMQAYYENKAGVFLQVDRGFDPVQQAAFYKILDLRVLKPAHGYNVRYALKWTPVIVALNSDVQTNGGHVVVVVNFDGQQYKVMDPGGVDFTGPGYTANVYGWSKADFDSRMVPQIFYW